jgi:hypothetical protein
VTLEITIIFGSRSYVPGDLLAALGNVPPPAMLIVELAGELLMVVGLVVLYGAGSEPCWAAAFRTNGGSLSDINRSSLHVTVSHHPLRSSRRIGLVAIFLPQATRGRDRPLESRIRHCGTEVETKLSGCGADMGRSTSGPLSPLAGSRRARRGQRPARRVAVPGAQDLGRVAQLPSA